MTICSDGNDETHSSRPLNPPVTRISPDIVTKEGMLTVLQETEPKKHRQQKHPGCFQGIGFINSAPAAMDTANPYERLNCND